jgi:transposase
MHILGIDVAKRTLAVTLLTADDTRYHQTCENTQEGFAALDAWLQSLGVTTVHACMEATNVYWEAVAAWLHAHGHTVSVVNGQSRAHCWLCQGADRTAKRAVAPGPPAIARSARRPDVE